VLEGGGVVSSPIPEVPLTIKVPEGILERDRTLYILSAVLCWAFMTSRSDEEARVRTERAAQEVAKKLLGEPMRRPKPPQNTFMDGTAMRCLGCGNHGAVGGMFKMRKGKMTCFHTVSVPTGLSFFTSHTRNCGSTDVRKVS
jgi:hypothetical protein